MRTDAARERSTNWRSLCLLLSFFILGSSALTATEARCTTLSVPSEYSTIQAALDATSAGDEVVLAPGVYEGPGNFDLQLPDWDVTVRSSDGAAVTVLQGDWTVNSQAFASGGVSEATVIQGLTMRHYAFSWGGAVRCSGGGLTILDCTFEENFAQLGGGVLFHNGAEGSVIGCRFTGNTATGGGGGLYAESPILVRDCEFRNNFASSIFEPPPVGGAIVGLGMTIEDCLVAGNESQGPAGGIHLSNGEVRGCTIAGNVGTGLHLVGNNDVTESIIWGNCGWQIRVDDGFSVIGCSIYQGGTGGNGALLPAPGLIFDDPLFCNPAPCERTLAGDYALDPSSPGWPTNNSCGVLYGAIDATCATSSVDAAPLAAHGSTRLSLGLPFPNPTTASFDLPVWLRNDARVELYVVDASGRRVWMEDRDLAAGESRILLNLDRSLPNVAAGAYRVVAALPGERSSRPLVVVGGTER